MMNNTFMKAVRTLMVFVLLCTWYTMPPVSAEPNDGNTYYVDSFNGNDTNAGTSEGAAWATLEKVNSIELQPGDSILFKRGSIWTGQLRPIGSGEYGSPITIDAYGDGPKPIINGNNAKYGAVFLLNQDYWNIRNLEVTNQAPDNNERRVGILVQFNDGKSHRHIHIQDCYVHDVNGMVDIHGDWDGEDWNGWNNSAGINVVISEDAAPYTSLDHLLIEGNVSSYNDSKGIVIMAMSGQAPLYPFTNVVVRNNIVDHNAADGIIVSNSDAPLVEYNTASYSHFGNPNRHAAGMWSIKSRDAVFQFNEAYGTQTTMDGQGFDIDWNSYNSIMQYNYSHHNVGGFLLICAQGQGGTVNEFPIVRYNISENDGIASSSVIFINGPVLGASIYNNTIYLGEDHETTFIRGGDWGGYADQVAIYNNIFHADGLGNWDLSAMTNVHFDSNVFSGNHINLPQDEHMIVADPEFVDPGSGSIGRDTVDGYMLQTTSPAIGSGKVISNNGGWDYWGNPVSKTLAPNRGAYNGPGAGFSPGQATLSRISAAEPPMTEARFNPDALYKIVNRASGLALGAEDDRTDESASIVQSMWESGDVNFNWAVADTGNGQYVLSRQASGRVLSVEQSSIYSGAEAQQQRWVSQDHQKWDIQELDNGYYRIVNMNSGLALAAGTAEVTVLAGVVDQYVASGSIRGSLVKQSQNAIDQAIHHASNGRSMQAVKALERLIRFLEKAKQQHIDDDVRSDLLARAESKINVIENDSIGLNDAWQTGINSSNNQQWSIELVTDRRADAQLIVLTQEYPVEPAVIDQISGYTLEVSEPNTVKVFVHNQSDAVVNGFIYGVPSGGWQLDVPSRYVEIGPKQIAEVEFGLSVGQDLAYNEFIPISFKGLFGGVETNKSTALVRAEQNIVKTHHVLDADGDDALKIIMENDSDAVLSMTSVDWSIDGQQGNQSYALTVPANSRDSVLLPLPQLTVGEYSYSLNVHFEYRPSINYSGALTVLDPSLIKSFKKYSVTVDGVLDSITDLPSVDLVTDGQVRISSWDGEADLSGSIWVTWDESDLYLSASVTDDVFSQSHVEGDIWLGDGLQFALSHSLPGESDEWYEFGAALTPQGAQLYAWSTPAGEPTGIVPDASIEVTRDDIQNKTIYEIGIPWSVLRDMDSSDRLFSLSLLVNDNDGSGRKGFIEWGAGIGDTKDPGLFMPIRLID